MKERSGMPVRNPHTAHCKRCGKYLIPVGEEKPIWWIQVGSNAYCKPCYEKYIEPFKKKGEPIPNPV